MKATIICCLAALIISGGVLLHTSSSTSALEKVETLASTVQTIDEPAPPPAAAVPNHPAPASSAPPQATHTRQKAQAVTGIEVIQSPDPNPASWKGQFNAGIQSRKIEIAPAMLSGQPLEPGTELSFQLFDDVQVTAIVANSFKNVNGTISTTAALQDSTWGRAFLACTDGQLQARIRIPESGRIYSIEFNQQTGHHYFLELDPALAEPDEGDDLAVVPQPLADEEPAKSDEKSVNPALVQLNESTEATAVIDVMIISSDDVLIAAGSRTTLDNRIALGISMANDAHTNSNSLILLHLVHSHTFSYAESGDPMTALNHLTYRDGVLDDVFYLRDTYGADFVMMINEQIGGGLAWGLPYTSGNSETCVFSVIGSGSIASYTLGHEIGHNMGLHHAPDQTYSPGPRSWCIDAYGFGNSTAGHHWHPTASEPGYGTVMTYTSGHYFPDGLSHIRVGLFSSPNLQDHGMAAGNVNTADSVRVLRSLRHVYAGYRDRLSTPSIQVDYPKEGETVTAGTTCNIFWDSYGVSGEVKIELLENGRLSRVIDVDTLNDRTYAWEVPAEISGTGYTIRISNLAGSIIDTGGIFAIQRPFIHNPMDSKPACTNTGNWQYGISTENNYNISGPKGAYTGINIYDTNLDGAPSVDSILTSPPIDCSGYSNVTLQFMGFFTIFPGDYAKIQVSSNGIDWTEIYSGTSISAWDWHKYEFDISATADGQSSVYVRWIYEEGGNISLAGMSLDDIQILGIYTSPEPAVTLSVDHTVLKEDNGSATVTAKLSGTHNEPVTVHLDYSGTADFGADYFASTTIVIPTGSITASTTIEAIDDQTEEANETIVVDINGVTNGNEDGFQEIKTLLTDDDEPVIAYTVSYNGNGNSSGFPPPDGDKRDGEDLNLAANSGNLRKVGSRFTGWNTSPDGKGRGYAEGGVYTTDASITLYASWKANAISPALWLLLK